jgi:preprotein translocase subunit SecG
VLGGLFIVLSIVMAAIAGVSREPVKIDTSLAKTATPFEQTQPARNPVQPAPTPNRAPQQNQNAPAVPLAQ